MQGLQKPLLYILNPNWKRKNKLPFDTDDQIYIEHTDSTSLNAGLDKKMPLLIDKVRLLSGFQSEQQNIIQKKLETLSSGAVSLLKRFLLEGHFSFRTDGLDELDTFVTSALVNDGDWSIIPHLRELEAQRFVITETESGGSRTLKFKRLNEVYRPYLQELLFTIT